MKPSGILRTWITSTTYVLTDLSLSVKFTTADGVVDDARTTTIAYRVPSAAPTFANDWELSSLIQNISDFNSMM